MNTIRSGGLNTLYADWPVMPSAGMYAPCSAGKTRPPEYLLGIIVRSAVGVFARFSHKPGLYERRDRPFEQPREGSLETVRDGVRSTATAGASARSDPGAIPSHRQTETLARGGRGACTCRGPCKHTPLTGPTLAATQARPPAASSKREFGRLSLSRGAPAAGRAGVSPPEARRSPNAAPARHCAGWRSRLGTVLAERRLIRLVQAP
jgi:hypothetical protein